MDARVSLKGAYYFAAQADLRLLFVDDDPILREFAQVHLADDNIQMQTASDGAEALDLIAAQAPDLVLLDLEMPRIDGFEVLRRLRDDVATARLPVIVVTGREDTGAIDRAFEFGATSFVAKPLNWRLLGYQIRYVHRTCINEQSLLEDRAEIAAARQRAEAKTKRVAAEGSKFLARAIAANPELRGAAQPFAEAVSLAAT